MNVSKSFSTIIYGSVSLQRALPNVGLKLFCRYQNSSVEHVVGLHKSRRNVKHTGNVESRCCSEQLWAADEVRVPLCVCGMVRQSTATVFVRGGQCLTTGALCICPYRYRQTHTSTRRAHRRHHLPPPLSPTSSLRCKLHCTLSVCTLTWLTVLGHTSFCGAVYLHRFLSFRELWQLN